MGNTSVKACEEPFLERLKNGDEVAFSELVNEHWNKIYNRANSLLDNHQDAEEVAQDTFIKARKSIGSFRGDCSISTWLYHIATNLARNKHWYWWRRKRPQSISLDMQVDGEGSATLCDILTLDPEGYRRPAPQIRASNQNAQRAGLKLRGNRQRPEHKRWNRKEQAFQSARIPKGRTV